MSKTLTTPRGKWRYLAAGIWKRDRDMALVERCKSGAREGVWKATPVYLGTPIQTRPCPAGFTVWEGYGTAKEAMSAVDQYLDEKDEKVRKALSAARRCIHGNPLGEPCADCDKEAREATA